ncbi:hypothetical protein DY000_02045273 [Brassica cretica]|uniref:Tafazzin family protein n=1 Tax=Brassica cretica TaxID=69181 RepID=A0ABQ7EZC4_BRACR|nr:hypothetical protein DY000_02045273 [Brassica cretica]
MASPVWRRRVSPKDASFHMDLGPYEAVRCEEEIVEGTLKDSRPLRPKEKLVKPWVRTLLLGKLGSVLFRLMLVCQGPTFITDFCVRLLAEGRNSEHQEDDTNSRMRLWSEAFGPVVLIPTMRCTER